MVYEISIGLQVAGATILAYQYWGNVKHEILREYFSGGNCNAKRSPDNDENVILERDKLRQAAGKIYRNRCSLIYIISGYLLSVFEKPDDSVIFSFLVVLITLVVLSLLGILLSVFLAKQFYKKDETTTFKQLDDQSIDVITPMSTDEIDALFRDNVNHLGS